MSVFVGKHRRHRKRTGSVPGWEGVSSFPETSPTWIFIERPLALSDPFNTICEQLGVAKGLQTQNASFFRMIVTFSLPDQVRSPREACQRVGCSQLRHSSAPSCLVFSIRK